MSDNVAVPSPFSAALRQAINNSHLSLAQVVAQLLEHGFKISRTTLSQWQTGISVPRRTSSLMLIAELEKILALPPQSLISLLPQTDTGPVPRLQNMHRPANTRRNPVTTSAFNAATTEKHFRSIEALVDPSREVVREAIEEHIAVSPDFCTVTQKLSTLVRIPDTDKPTMHTKTWWTTGDTLPEEGDIGIYDIKGAYPGSTQTVSFDEGMEKITRLEFPPYVMPGSLHTVSYTLHFRYPAPITETTQRLISSKLHFYSCAVTFEGKAPNLLHWILSRTNAQHPDVANVIETREMQPHDGSVQVTLEDVEHVACFFRWA